ncbi:membrane protein insertion efficiency factor YidD [Alkanindiges sp. WGS2144]|uniref:membrane protein insertion efficiency factor YidD n=1 Tax=Alkanindiges sp. WGS2144 TaxID=3366808 RepID=UPI0037511ACB
MRYQLYKASNQRIIDLMAQKLIEGYQRHISPIKGFKCAAGQLYGDATCSAAIKLIVQTQGVAEGLPAIAQQLRHCQQAARQLKETGQAQAGVFCCVLPIPL